MSDQSEMKVDLRVKRTYKLLLDALVGLLEEKTFEEIHVTDICEKAMVHRTTFYKHFEDKYHLLRFGLEEIQKSFEKDIATHESFSSLKEYYIYFIRSVLACLRDNQRQYFSLITMAAVLPERYFIK